MFSIHTFVLKDKHIKRVQKLVDMTWSCRKPLLCVSECVWKLQKSIIQLDSVVEVADIVGNDEE